MGLSIFLSKVFSIYFLLVGLAIIIRRNWYKDVLTQLLECKHCCFIIGIVTVIIGALLVVVHPKFTADWRSLVTVIVWLTLLKGIAYLFLPDKILAHKKYKLEKPATLYIGGAISIILAVVFGYFGYFWW